MAAKYDETLGKFLVEHNVNSRNIIGICVLGLRSRKAPKKAVAEIIKLYQRDHDIGCIFVLPGNRRDGCVWVHYTNMSADEIRRIVKMKAFI